MNSENYNQFRPIHPATARPNESEYNQEFVEGEIEPTSDNDKLQLDSRSYPAFPDASNQGRPLESFSSLDELFIPIPPLYVGPGPFRFVSGDESSYNDDPYGNDRGFEAAGKIIEGSASEVPPHSSFKQTATNQNYIGYDQLPAFSFDQRMPRVEAEAETEADTSNQLDTLPTLAGGSKTTPAPTTHHHTAKQTKLGVGGLPWFASIKSRTSYPTRRHTAATTINKNHKGPRQGKNWITQLVAHSPMWVNYLILASLLLALIVPAIVGIMILSKVGGSSSPLPLTVMSSSNNSPNTAMPPASLEATLNIKLKSQEQATRKLDNQTALATGAVQSVEFDLTVEGTHPATGNSTRPAAKASGPVKLFNPGAVVVTLPTGTQLAQLTGSNGVVYHYLLTQSVSVPATDLASNQIGTVETTVQADQGGAAGNLASGFGRLSVGRGLQLIGTGPLAGGTDRPVTVASKQDLSELLSSLQAQSEPAVLAHMKTAAVTVAGVGGSATTVASPSTSEGARTSASGAVPQGFGWLSDFNHQVTNSVFTPSQKEGEEVGTTGSIEGRLVLHVKALIYQPARLAEVSSLNNSNSSTAPDSATAASGAGSNISVTTTSPSSRAWQVVSVRVVEVGGNKDSGAGTTAPTASTVAQPSQLEVALVRPVDAAQAKAQILAQYKTWLATAHITIEANGQGTEEAKQQLESLTQQLQSRAEVEKVELVLPSALQVAPSTIATPGFGSTAGSGMVGTTTSTINLTINLVN